MRVAQGVFPSVSSLSCGAAQLRLGPASTTGTSSPLALRRSEGRAAGLYPVRHKRPMGVVMEAVLPIGAGRVWREKEAPPNRSGIGCSGGVSVKKPPAHRRILAIFFACFQALPLRPVSSSGRDVLRLDVSFQCPQVESQLHQMAVVLPDFLLGPPVPYLVKYSFGKNSMVSEGVSKMSYHMP